MLTNEDLEKLASHVEGQGWLLRTGDYDPQTRLTDTLDGDKLAACFRELLALRSLPEMGEIDAVQKYLVEFLILDIGIEDSRGPRQVKTVNTLARIARRAVATAATTQKRAEDAERELLESNVTIINRNNRLTTLTAERDESEGKVHSARIFIDALSKYLDCGATLENSGNWHSYLQTVANSWNLRMQEACDLRDRHVAERNKAQNEAETLKSELAALKSAPSMAEVDALMVKEHSTPMGMVHILSEKCEKLADLARRSIAKIAEQESAIKWQVEHTEALEKNWETLVEVARKERDEVVGLLKWLAASNRNMLESLSDDQEDEQGFQEARDILEICGGKLWQGSE